MALAIERLMVQINANSAIVIQAGVNHRRCINVYDYMLDIALSMFTAPHNPSLYGKGRKFYRQNNILGLEWAPRPWVSIYTK